MAGEEEEQEEQQQLRNPMRMIDLRQEEVSAQSVPAP